MCSENIELSYENLEISNIQCAMCSENIELSYEDLETSNIQIVARPKESFF